MMLIQDNISLPKSELLLMNGAVMRYKPAVFKQGVFIDRYLELSTSMLNYFGKAPQTRAIANK